MVLEFAALNIVGFDLSTSLAGDPLQLTRTCGISDHLTGIMLILIDWTARPLALAMLVSWPKDTSRPRSTWSARII